MEEFFLVRSFILLQIDFYPAIDRIFFFKSDQNNGGDVGFKSNQANYKKMWHKIASIESKMRSWFYCWLYKWRQYEWQQFNIFHDIINFYEAITESLVLLSSFIFPFALYLCTFQLLATFFSSSSSGDCLLMYLESLIITFICMHRFRCRGTCHFH